MDNDNTSITLSLALVNGILGYLGTRPFAEVHRLVHAIEQQAAPQVPKPSGEEKVPQ